jgi:hypothetical protein
VRRTPTDNFRESVRRRKDQGCGWRFHCPPGTCLREVVSAFELLAKNNEHRFVYPTVPALTKMCNGRFRATGSKPYKQRAVEAAVHILVERQILSKKFVFIVNGLRRSGRIFNPHASMTKRYPLACHFLEAGKTPGTWTFDGRWFAEPHVVGEFGLVLEGETAVATAVVNAVQSEKCDGVCDGLGDGTKSLDATESNVLTDLAHDVLAAKRRCDLAPSLVSPVSTAETTNTRNPANPGPNGQSQSQSTASAIASTGLTNLTKDAAMAFKVKDHFLAERVSSARDLFALLTDGELEYENPTMRAYEHTKGNGDFQYEQLERCCRDVLDENADRPLPGRKALADLMHKCAVRLRQRHKRNAPKCWYRLIERLRDGDPKICMLAGAEQTFDGTQHLRNYCNPYAHTWLHEMFHNAVIETKSDLAPWEPQLVVYTRSREDARVGYGDGWACMHALMLMEKEDGKEESPVLAAVRDWLWEHDFTHAKTDVPPWEVVAPSAE